MSIYEDIVSLSEDVVQERVLGYAEIVTRLTDIAIRVDEVDSKVVFEIGRLKSINPASTLNKGRIDNAIDGLNQIREELY